MGTEILISTQLVVILCGALRSKNSPCQCYYEEIFGQYSWFEKNFDASFGLNIFYGNL